MDASWALKQSPYDLLGVSEDASNAEVRTAYREMARLFHPDRNQTGDAASKKDRTEHFMKIKKAYDVLSDPGSRRLYDGCLVAREKLVRKNLYKSSQCGETGSLGARRAEASFVRCDFEPAASGTPWRIRPSSATSWTTSSRRRSSKSTLAC